MGETSANRRNRYRAQVNLSAEAGTPLAFIIQYLKELPAINITEATKELLCNAYLVRAMRHSDDIRSTATTDDFIEMQGWQSIWYFWGVIEALCVVTRIDPMDVIRRLNSRQKSVAEPKAEARLRVSDFANDFANIFQMSSKRHPDNYSSSNGSNNSTEEAEDPEALIKREQEKDNIDDMSSFFG